jgi:hypothetical protein
VVSKHPLAILTSKSHKQTTFFTIKALLYIALMAIPSLLIEFMALADKIIYKSKINT